MLLTDDVRTVKLGSLTTQERECLRLVGLQLSSKEIAHQLGISKASVDTYCNRARAKLGVTNRREAAQLIRSLETVGPSPPGPVGHPAPARPAAERAAARVGLLPPVASLGAAERLGVILGGAVVLAVAFGMLMNGLQSLNDVVAAAQTRATADAAPR
jgi:DNA-binding CsgD family transcriptional regulator